MKKRKILTLFIVISSYFSYTQGQSKTCHKNYEDRNSVGTITCFAPDSLFLLGQHSEAINKLRQDTIQLEYIKFYQLAANYVLLAEIDSAFLYLNKFIDTSPDDRMIYVDKRWDVLRKDTAQWNSLINKIETAFLQCVDSVLNKELAMRLFYLSALDQKYRLYGVILRQLPNGDTLYMESSDLDLSLSQQIDSIINQYGFPGISMVGKLASTSAFLLVQHSPKIHKYYKAAKKSYEQGDVIPQQYALMTDRYLMKKMRKQIYGTQGFANKRIEKKYNGHGIIWPVKDFKHVEERRKNVGISTSIEEYAKSIDCIIPEKYYKR